MKFFLPLIAALIVASPVIAAEDDNQIELKPEIHGSIRAKYEYQPEVDLGRFQVRNARINFTGYAIDKVYYKAEIDLSDQGVTRMLDAYVKLNATENFSAAIGQMRVPFTIDAHRSPYSRFFANRSFIGKQVGDVRDVGVVLSYKNKLSENVPFTLEGGVFNGDGLDGQKVWQSNYNHSLKMQLWFGDNWNLTISEQSLKPALFRVNMYDIGAYYKTENFHIEAEYLYKTYEKNSFDDVHSVDIFAVYNVPLRKGMFKNISFLGRYDMMSEHSDGSMTDDDILNGVLTADDAARQRVTGGVTLSFAKMFKAADIRINYEKYFYDANSLVAPDDSELDKFVLEFVCKF